MKNQTPEYEYFLKNHLANVRAILKDDYPGDNVLFSYADYYPGGFEMPDRQKGSTYRFGYQGQFAEKDQETGFNHFEAREYDPRIMWWTVTDPAGQYWSPYVGMGNNPISGADPDGRFWQELGNWVGSGFKKGTWKSDEALAFNKAHPGSTWHGKRANGYYTFDDVYTGHVGPGFIPGIGCSKNFGAVKDFGAPFCYWYNSHWTGKIIPDVLFIETGGSFSYIFGGEAGTGFALQLKGKEGVHFYSYTRGGATAGLEGGVGLKIGYGSYDGDSRNFSIHKSFEGSGTVGADISLLAASFGGSASRLDPNGGVLRSYSIGSGAKLGAKTTFFSGTKLVKIL